MSKIKEEKELGKNGFRDKLIERGGPGNKGIEKNILEDIKLNKNGLMDNENKG